MDAKITLCFDGAIILKAKKYAADNNISLSRLMELILGNITTNRYKTLEDLPISEWVNMVAEGAVEYKTAKKSRKKMKDEFYASKK